MAQVQPLISRQPEMRAIVEKIRDAKIKIPDDVVNNRKLTGMFKTQSPSAIAEKILAKYPAKAPEKGEDSTSTETKE